jgi:hypothetical protein
MNSKQLPLLLVLAVNQPGSNFHYCLVSLMWMKIGSNDITALPLVIFSVAPLVKTIFLDSPVTAQ